MSLGRQFQLFIFSATSRNRAHPYAYFEHRYSMWRLIQHQHFEVHFMNRQNEMRRWRKKKKKNNNSLTFDECAALKSYRDMCERVCETRARTSHDKAKYSILRCRYCCGLFESTFFLDGFNGFSYHDTTRRVEYVKRGNQSQTAFIANTILELLILPVHIIFVFIFGKQ